jgi:alkanesulfonate monooxygenase SsuD/methylene tetrahydromethanopterin reductase-like flavin-dependent oxidoreductase (luciferase family)
MLLSAKLAPTVDYPVLERFWRAADELGFHSVANYDHFYGLTEPTAPTLEGWTSLAAMAAVVARARVTCLVSGVLYRNPAVLAKMAVTVDHISGGRLVFGLGAGWHEAEHRGYGIDFPGAGTRVAMLDEALTVIRRMWTEESVRHEGRFYTLRDAICEPKPLQRPHPPIVVGGEKPKMLRVIAAPCRRVECAQPRRRCRMGENQRRPRRGMRRGRPGSGRDPALGAAVRSTRGRGSPRRATGRIS